MLKYVEDKLANFPNPFHPCMKRIYGKYYLHFILFFFVLDSTSDPMLLYLVVSFFSIKQQTAAAIHTFFNTIFFNWPHNQLNKKVLQFKLN